MYFIIKESIKILTYGYLHCNEKFKATFLFNDFKNETYFAHSKTDFLKSYSYLKEANIIRDQDMGVDVDRFEFYLNPFAIQLAEDYLCDSYPK